MAAAMRRMNGAPEKMSVGALLLLAALLLNDFLMCQGDPTDAATVIDDTAEPFTEAADTQALGVSGAVTQPEGPADVTGAGTLPPLNVTLITDVGSLLNAGNTGEQVMTAMPAGGELLGTTNAPAAAPVEPETQAPLQLGVPVINCEKKEIVSEAYVMAVVKTSTCEETKSILETIPAAWCADDNCRLDVSQDGNKILVASPDGTSRNIAAALLSENVKEQLGVSEVASSPLSSSGASVFVGVLLTGLLLAAGLIGGYGLKNRRTSGDKGIRLAEEAYPVDGENQGNTLVSVAPLNPPPETQEPTETTEIPEPKEAAEIQEKPGANGETPEEAKSDPPPPTNGHSKADTEL